MSEKIKSDSGEKIVVEVGNLVLAYDVNEEFGILATKDGKDHSKIGKEGLTQLHTLLEVLFEELEELDSGEGI